MVDRKWRCEGEESSMIKAAGEPTRTEISALMKGCDDIHKLIQLIVFREFRLEPS